MESELRLSITKAPIRDAIVELENSGQIVKTPTGHFKLSLEYRKRVSEEVEDADNVNKLAKDYFESIAVRLFPERFSAGGFWEEFDGEFVMKLIDGAGASAYHLISGEPLDGEQLATNAYLKKFDEKDQPKLRELITSFLNPKVPEVRDYIGRMLHARFCVNAIGLPEDVLSRISESYGKQIRFELFVDTNFLFSLIEIHDNPSNESAIELREVIGKVQKNLNLNLYITPETIKEARGSILNTKDRLGAFPIGGAFADVALSTDLSGMAKRFMEERKRRGTLSAEDWFEPYLSNFLAIARDKGVELFNEDISDYSMDTRVLADIKDVMDFEKAKLPVARQKSYERIRHDVVLWHFVNDKRDAYVESVVDAIYWILTVDFRFIGFDEHKRYRSSSEIALCIHPTSLIQILQFWIPRSREFEEAMLGGLRLPFLFQEFDADAEKTTLKIIEGIGHIQGGDQLGQETVEKIVLNKELRARLKETDSDDEEKTLIRDVLVEELEKRNSENESKLLQVQGELQKKEAAIAANSNESAQKEAEIAELRGEVDRLKKKEADRTDLERTASESRRIRNLNVLYLVSAVVLVGVAFLLSWLMIGRFPLIESALGTIPAYLLSTAVCFVLVHLVVELAFGKNERIVGLSAFQLVKRFRGFLWLVVILGIIFPIITGLITNSIQKKMDAVNGNLNHSSDTDGR